MYSFYVDCREIDLHPNDTRALHIGVKWGGEQISNMWTSIENVIGMLDNMPIAAFETIDMSEIVVRSITLHAHTSNWECSQHESLRRRHNAVMNYAKLWIKKHEEE